MTTDLLPMIGAVSDLVVEGMNMPFAWMFTFGGISLSAGDICCIMIVVVEIYQFFDDILDGSDGEGEPAISWSWK